jgi:hypothetical protein
VDLAGDGPNRLNLNGGSEIRQTNSIQSGRSGLKQRTGRRNHDPDPMENEDRQLVAERSGGYIPFSAKAE